MVIYSSFVIYAKERGLVTGIGISDDIVYTRHIKEAKHFNEPEIAAKYAYIYDIPDFEIMEVNVK